MARTYNVVRIAVPALKKISIHFVAHTCKPTFREALAILKDFVGLIYPSNLLSYLLFTF